MKNPVKTIVLSVAIIGWGALSAIPVQADQKELDPEMISRAMAQMEAAVKTATNGAYLQHSQNSDIRILRIMQDFQKFQNAGVLHKMSLNGGAMFCRQTPHTPVTYVPAPDSCAKDGAQRSNGICTIQVTCQGPGSFLDQIDLKTKTSYNPRKPIQGVASCLGKSVYNSALKKAADGCPSVSECIQERLVLGRNVQTNFELKASRLADVPAESGGAGKGSTRAN